MRAVKFFSLWNLSILMCLCLGISVFGQNTEPVKTELQNNIVENNSVSKKSDPDNDENSVNVKDERYRIGYQDTLDVQVFRHPQLSGAVSVNPDGTIYLPRLKAPIIAVCKTERELADHIAAEYKKDYLKNPFVTVRAVDQKSQSLGVIGAVEKPGNFYVNRRVHLLELLAFAGGPSKEAGTQVLVARTGSTSNCQLNQPINNNEEPEIELLTFKLREIKEAKEILWMQPGDIVSVLEADPYYVHGNVEEPGMYYLKSPTTLMQAIATAKGFRAATKKDYLRILRQKTDSNEREELVFSLKDIESKKIEDPLLQPNDIVAVSEDKAKSIINAVIKSVTGGLGNVPYIIRK